MSETTFDYSAAIQNKILAMLLLEPKGFTQSIDVIKPEFFDHPALRAMAVILYKHFQKYHSQIGLEEFTQEFEELLGADSRLPVDEYRRVFDAVIDVYAKAIQDPSTFDYVRDKVVAFARTQAVRNAVSDAADIVKKQKNYEEILNKVRAALAIGELNQDIGVFYFSNLENRLEQRRNGLTRRDTAISTGIASLDRKLGGGLGRGELGVIMGPMKRGKTIFSVNMAVGAATNPDGGIKVVHYIMEGSEDRLQVLYDARICDISKDMVVRPEYADQVREKVNEFYGRPGIERIELKHFPALSCSPMAIENHLDRLRMYNKYEPELIIVDYLGLMISNNKKITDSGDKYDLFGQITKELLSLAQRGGYAIWLLHQSTRGSFTKKIVDMDDSADSIGPMRDADLILTLNKYQPRTEEKDNPEAMRDSDNKITVFIAGGREVADRESVSLRIDKLRCKFTDLEG